MKADRPGRVGVADAAGQHHLILLCGMPRSGTTWLGKIFDSHPDVLYRHEPDTLRPMSGVPLLASLDDVEILRPSVEAFLAGLSSIRETKVSATVPVFRKSRQTHIGWRLRRLGVNAARLLGRVVGEVSVPEWFGSYGVNGTRLVWKSIESTGRLGVLARTIPEARSILVMRHPCGYIASVLRGESRRKFSGGTATSEDTGAFDLLAETPQAQRHGLDSQSFLRMAPVERLAWRWALFNEKALDEIEGLPTAMAFKYEDLCADPRAVAGRLFEFAGLAWNEQTEEFVNASTSEDRSAYYSVFKDPLKSANRWRQDLDQETVDRIMSIVRKSRTSKFYSS